ncbi:MAG: DUF5715 family protein [Paludibacteraceae bacterium]
MTQTKKTTRKRKSKSTKKIKDTPILPYLLIGVAITILIIVGIEVDNYLSKNAISEVTTTCNFCRNATASISSKKTFNDFNEIHLKHARKNGLKKPIKTNKELFNTIESLQQDGKLVKITSNKYYHIPRLTHSHPYLTPEAANLLQEIGMRFHAKLREHNLPKYKFVVSSLLRTEESQEELRHSNQQATHNESAHYYGTTFDISYSNYKRFGFGVQDKELEQLLTETLRELRSECRLLIVNEKRNKCYHITVVKCRES